MSFKDDHYYHRRLVSLTRGTTVFRRPSRESKGGCARPRRKMLPSVRLGGKRGRSGGLFLVRIIRRLRLGWLRLKRSQAQMLRNLKAYYSSLVKDLMEARVQHQRIVPMDTTYFIIPVIAMYVVTIPSHLNRSRFLPPASAHV